MTSNETLSEQLTYWEQQQRAARKALFVANTNLARINMLIQEEAEKIYE